MTFKRVEDLKEYLVRQNLTGTVVLESPSYISAVVGIRYQKDSLDGYLRVLQ